MPLREAEVVEGEDPYFIYEGELLIPAPQRSSYRRGLNSDKVADAPVSFSISEDEVAVARAAAELLGM